MVMSQKLGASSGSAARTAASTWRSRSRSWPSSRSWTRRAAPRPASRRPRRCPSARHGGRERLQGEPRVGVDAERRVVGFELAQVGLDVDDLTARRERAVVAGQLAEPGAHGEQHVGVFEEVGGVPVLQPGLQRQRVLPWERALAAERRRDRGAQLLGQFEQRRFGAGADHAAAGQDDRPLGAFAAGVPPRRPAPVAVPGGARWPPASPPVARPRRRAARPAGSRPRSGRTAG